jgi:Flp pilus assembly protein TadG
MTRTPLMRLRVTADERGSVLVITVIVMTTLLIFAAYAIDEGIWFVHGGHLQTEADAAALAGAQNFQFPCTTGTATTGTTDNKIATTVHEYDGTMAGPNGLAPKSGFNEQVPVTPTPSTIYSSTQHNLISQINQSNFTNQSQPSDTGLSGSPCTDGVIDVKLSETNLPSFFPFVSPKYINAQARVSILQETASLHAEPFAEPLPTPNTVTATLVDESNKDAVIAGPVTLTPSAEKTTWTTAAPVSVPFNNVAKSGALVGLRVAASGGTTATCGTGGVTCYVKESELGVAYTRAWSNSGTPGLPLSAPVPPQAGEVNLLRNATEPCPNAPSGTFSNFVSSSTSCKVALSANVVFTSPGGTALSCETASLTLEVNGKNVAMTCPVAAGTPNGTWTSAPVTIAPNSGASNFTLSWKLTAGNKPAGAWVTGGDATGKCVNGAKACVGSFDEKKASEPEVVQRLYSGAFDTVSEETSKSGPILGATVTDASTGNELMSLQRSATAKSVNITVTVLGFQNSQTIPSAPIELSFGGNQENAALECGGNAGNPELEKALVEGCNALYGTTSAPAATACAGSPEPPVCIKENPGGGKLEKDLDKAMNQRINEGGNVCVHQNHWASPNTIPEVLTQSPADLRLITTIMTDYGALSNGASEVPIRAFAEFYVTGWSGDPCIGIANGTSNGLAYTKDDNPGSKKGVLLGHFVKYVNSSPTGTGSGSCSQNAFGNCIAVLTK